MDKNIAISLHNVSVTFRQRKSFFRHELHCALTDVSFDLFKGETLGIIGRNGCGKSSLLKVIAGVYQPDIGNVNRRGLRVSLQTLAAGFDEELTGRDNAILSSMLLGHKKSVALANMDEINEFAELGEYFNKPVKTYSSGMRARLGFAVAITMVADVLLVDEVLGVGDASFRQKAEASILSKVMSDQTVVFVSHSASQVKKLCKRVVWLEQGKVLNVGDAATVLEEYEKYSKVLAGHKEKRSL